MEKILLTISFLTYGRNFDELKRFMKPLKELSKAVPTEILAVDTGCNNEVRRYLDKNVDMVVPFEWCGDFSKARNEGLKRARGEWFMTIDDDEVIENVAPLVNFLRSDESRSFNSLFYIMENYSSYLDEKHDDVYLLRMVRMDKETRFVGAVHEIFSPVRRPAKYLDMRAKHYGYASVDSNNLREKTERNLRIILEELSKNPDNIILSSHLPECYQVLGEYGKMEESSKYCLEIVPKEDGYRDIITWLTIQYLLSLKLQGKYVTIIEEYSSLLDNPLLIEGMAMVLLYAMESFYFIKDMENALSTALLYIGLYKEQQAAGAILGPTTVSGLGEAFSLDTIKRVYLIIKAAGME